jgi:hypothetical protein
MDLIFLVKPRPSSGSSTLSFTLACPASTVPVTTVPCPRIWKQWSIMK